MKDIMLDEDQVQTLHRLFLEKVRRGEQLSSHEKTLYELLDSELTHWNQGR